MKVEQIDRIVKSAFSSAWENRSRINDNRRRSAHFVFKLAEKISEVTPGEALVQKVDDCGRKSPGEWLFDITIVSKRAVTIGCRNRSSEIVDKIFWVVESEFSTNLNEFCKDFAKLIHVKSENYLYVAGLNQENEEARVKYIEAQAQLAKSLVKNHCIEDPFFIAFVPTPGKTENYESLWDGCDKSELLNWLHVTKLF
jgi:hypothetical protein